MSEQKFKYIQTEKSLLVKQKAFFITFNALSVDRNSLGSEKAPLIFRNPLHVKSLINKLLVSSKIISTLRYILYYTLNRDF